MMIDTIGKRRYRRWTLALLLPLAAALMLASLQAAAQGAAQGTAVRGGRLNVGMEGDWPTLDPHGMGTQTDRQVGRAVYDTLLEYNDKGELVPALAESFSISPDALSLKLKLRAGVKFHDGTPFNADAVVFNFKRLQDPKCRCASDLSVLAEARASGPLEVEFKMKIPAAHFGVLLADVAGMMVSPAAVQKFGKDYGANPVGTGPFVFKEWRRGNFFHAVRNPGYWREGRPYLDEIYFRPMGDEQTRIVALRNGEIDLALVPNPKDVAEVLKDKSLNVIEHPSLGTVFIAFNTKSAAFSDARVRRAIAHATDRAAINRAINRDVFKIAHTPFGAGLAPHEKGEGFRDFDLEKAQALIKEVGKPPKFKLTTVTTPLGIQASQALQQMWRKLGVDVEINQLETTQAVRDFLAGNFDVIFYRFSGGGVDPDLNVYKFFHSKSPQNVVGYSNPEMDKLLEAGRASPKPSTRLDIYTRVNSLLARDVPYNFLYYYTPYMLGGKNLHGVPRAVDGMLRVADVWKSK